MFFVQLEVDTHPQKNVNELKHFSNDPTVLVCFHSKLFREEDFAVHIRKKQSAIWALKWFVNID